MLSYETKTSEQLKSCKWKFRCLTKCCMQSRRHLHKLLADGSTPLAYMHLFAGHSTCYAPSGS